MAEPFHIDAEFKGMLPKLTKEEFAGLRAQLVEREEVDALVVGVIQGDRFLLDGHNRYEICTNEGIRFPTREIHFPDRDAAMLWIAEHQLGRRNLTPQQRAYYIGKEYLAKKKLEGRPDGKLHQSDGETAKALGEKHKVGPATVERDAKFAKATDALAPEAKAKVLSGEGGQTKKEIATGIFCDRCKRNGPSKNCQTCAGLRAEAGKKKKAAKAKPKSGEVKFDWKKWEASFGDQVRQIDRLAKLSEKSKDSPRPESLRATLSMFRAEFRQTYREFTGLKPPSE